MKTIPKDYATHFRNRGGRCCTDTTSAGWAFFCGMAWMFTLYVIVEGIAK